MNREEFRRKRIEGRKKLLEKIIDVFKSLHPVAIHEFGSGTTGFKDEFSDIDIWITFKDDEIEDVVKNLKTIFRDIAPIVVRHHSKSWSPVGGSANSVIHETKNGLFIVDYYISKYSETVIKEGSVAIYGDDTLPRGEWRLNKEVNKSIRDSHILKKDINLLLNLIFISSKGLVRKWNDDEFTNTLKTVHRTFRKRHKKKIKRRRISLGFRVDYRLLADLYAISNKNQKKAILKIKEYLQQVEELYN
jgi:predicted nucleotidyltransferase